MLRHLLFAVILVLLGSPFAFSQSGTALVFPFENESGDRSLDWIGEGIAELIIERLQSEPGLYVFLREERLAGFEKLGIPDTAAISRATAMKLGWDNGSDRVITGRFTGTAANFGIFARMVDLGASGAAQEIKVSGRLEDFIPLTNTLSWQLLKIILPSTRTPESDYTLRPPPPRSAFENYIRGLLSTDPERRNEFFENAIRLRPQYSAAIFQLGRLRYFEGDFKPSNMRLEKIGANDPYFVHAQFLIGLNEYRLANYDHAEAVLSALTPIYDVLVNLGAAKSAKDDSVGAISTWQRATVSEPFSVEAAFNIGYESFMKGDLNGAIRALEQTLRLQGRDGEAMFLLARSYERLGRLEDSQKMMAQARRISPRVERWLTQPMPRLERLRTTPQSAALRNVDVRRTWTPDRLLRRAKEQDLGTWLDFVQTQVDSQFYGEAIRELNEAMLVYPRSADAHTLMAQIFERPKIYDRAVAEYEFSIGLRPSAELYVQLARIHRLRNQNALAFGAVREALRLEPDNAAAKAMRVELEKSPPVVVMKQKKKK